MHYNFEEDLKTSDKIEVNVIKKLQEAYPDFKFHTFSGTKAYDCLFSMGGKTYSLEIKADYFAVNTGNMVVEYESWGKPAGIVTTQANFIAYAMMRSLEDFDLYLINTNKNKRMVEEKLYFDTMVGGDIGSNTKLYRFKMDVFEKYATKVGM